MNISIYQGTYKIFRNENGVVVSKISFLKFDIHKTRACIHLAFAKENFVNYKRGSTYVKCMAQKQTMDKD